MIYFPLHRKKFQEELKGGVRNHHLLQNLVYFSGYEFLKVEKTRLSLSRSPYFYDKVGNH